MDHNFGRCTDLVGKLTTVEDTSLTHMHCMPTHWFFHLQMDRWYPYLFMCHMFSVVIFTCLGYSRSFHLPLQSLGIYLYGRWLWICDLCVGSKYIIPHCRVTGMVLSCPCWFEQIKYASGPSHLGLIDHLCGQVSVLPVCPDVVILVLKCDLTLLVIEWEGGLFQLVSIQLYNLHCSLRTSIHFFLW